MQLYEIQVALVFVVTATFAVAAAGAAWGWRKHTEAIVRIELVYHWQDRFDRGEVTREQAREKVGDIVDTW